MAVALIYICLGVSVCLTDMFLLTITLTDTMDTQIYARRLTTCDVHKKDVRLNPHKGSDV